MEHMDNELLQLCYNLYKIETDKQTIRYSYRGFISSKEYKKYYNIALKKIRIEKLNKICSKKEIK